MSFLYLADLLAREHAADLLREAEGERLRRAARGSGVRDDDAGRRPLPPTPGPSPTSEPKRRWRFRPVG